MHVGTQLGCRGLKGAGRHSPFNGRQHGAEHAGVSESDRQDHSPGCALLLDLLPLQTYGVIISIKLEA